MKLASQLKFRSCYNRRVVFFLLFAILVLWSNNSAFGQKVLLQFKPTNTPYKVATSTGFEKTTTNESGEKETGGESITTIFERYVTNPGEGVLVVRRKILSSEQKYSVSRSVISPSGKALVPPGKRTKMSLPRISLQFPEKPVGKDDFWTYVIPADEGFPAKTKIHCKLKSFITTKTGDFLAVIVMKSSSTAIYEEHGFKGDISYKSKIVFDVNNGRVTKMASKSKLITTDMKTEKHLPQTELLIEVSSKILKP